jgi:hypothetical protein
MRMILVTLINKNTPLYPLSRGELELQSLAVLVPLSRGIQGDVKA